MKKVLSIGIVLLLVFSLWSTTALAAYEAPTNFSSLFNYGDTVYTTEFFGTNGGITFCSRECLSLLPVDFYYDYIYSFCVYHDKFYFIAGEEGSDTLPAKIYSCNLDGSGLTLLADNASNYSFVTIVDGILYYDVYTSHDGFYPGYYGGIYSINLNDLSWKKICADKDVTISYCDGDYIYYTIGFDKPYAIRTNGSGKMRVNANCDEFASKNRTGILKGNHFYYLDGNQLYARNKNGGNSRWLGTVPYGDLGYVSIESVTDDAVYCVSLTSEGYDNYAEVYRFGK